MYFLRRAESENGSEIKSRRAGGALVRESGRALDA
jgi:hypothetical protein